MKHYTIPFFITHKGCPFTCIFCRQDKISGHAKSTQPEDIAPIIGKYLKTIPSKKTRVEVGLFGGSFTGLEQKAQIDYLSKITPFLNKGVIHGIRLSTRPDHINQQNLVMLKKFGVTRIELGVESSSDRVLKKIQRGHTSIDIKKASKLILENNISLGHQIMVGLPGSALKDEIETVNQSIKLGVSEMRIYPVIVIKGTELAKIWKKGLYKPLSENQAIKRCAKLIQILNKKEIPVIRCGLHPSEGLISGKEILAGPFHVSFRQKVETYLYKELFKSFLKHTKNYGSIKKIYYNPRETACVLGHQKSNAVYVEEITKRKNLFNQNPRIKMGSIQILFNNNRCKILTKI